MLRLLFKIMISVASVPSQEAFVLTQLLEKKKKIKRFFSTRQGRSVLTRTDQYL